MDPRVNRLEALKRQVQRLENRLQQLRQRSDRYSYIRLGSFALGFFVSAAALLVWGVRIWAGATVLSLIPFIVAVYIHRRIEDSIARHAVWLALKKTHIARMRLDWERIPSTLPMPARMEHPFAADLDLLGERSLHQLLDTAVTHEGSERLRGYLLETAPDLTQLTERQARVRQLTRMPRFRDKLALNARLAAGETDQKWPGRRLLNWLARHTETASLRLTLMGLALLAPVNILLLLLDIAGILPPLWPVSWLIYAAISLRQSSKIEPLFADSAFLVDSLRTLGTVFTFLETYPYAGNKALRRLCASFLDEQSRPSQQLKRITRVAAAAGLRYNPIVSFLLNALVPWDIYFAHRLDQYKEALAALLPTWLDVWFELEALSSLATFAYLNPQAVFPEVVAGTQSSLFEAQDVGHPLIPYPQRICNDFRIDEIGTIYIITGSNMAGKSSFLRTLGVALSLAYAGGPVIARRLHTTLFRLFAAIRVTDSVTDGFSFFYAEVRRLRALLAALQEVERRPLFFLIDEIFRGTNNRERLIGSRAYIQALAGGNGVGVIATHDLELVKLADELPTVVNYHFRDDVVDGRMVFDYKLHPGPSPTTNALKIMRLAGLPVELPPDEAD